MYLGLLYLNLSRERIIASSRPMYRIAKNIRIAAIIGNVMAKLNLQTSPIAI
jgi:hypothetical protein